MASVDLVDETFIAVPPRVLAPIVADPSRWRTWWPELVLTVFMDRADKGQRWSITGSLVGSSEIWLEECGDGTLVHYYLRADQTARHSDTEIDAMQDGPAAWRRYAKVRAAQAKAWKSHVWALKDEVEGNRRPGAPGVGSTPEGRQPTT